MSLSTPTPVRNGIPRERRAAKGPHDLRGLDKQVGRVRLCRRLRHLALLKFIGARKPGVVEGLLELGLHHG